MTTINDYISTPGEILLEEFLLPLGISQYRLAKAIGRSQSTITDIISGRRSITADMAVRLGKALGTSAEFWLNLESTYQIKKINNTIADKVVVLVA